MKSPFRQPRIFADLLCRFRRTRPNVPRPETQWSGLFRLSSVHPLATCHSGANSERAISNSRCTCSGSNIAGLLQYLILDGEQVGCHAGANSLSANVNPRVESRSGG